MNIFKQVDEKLQSKLLFLVSIIFVFCAIFAITLSAKLVEADTQSTEGYNVYFDLRGGSMSSGSVSQFVRYGEDATPPVVKADDEFYLFAGWVGDYQNVTSDRYIYATYDRYYDVVFTHTAIPQYWLWEVTGELNQKVLRGGSAEPPTLELQGYIFLGWYGDYDNITENTELKPIWTADVGDTYYTVTFNLRGGEWQNSGSIVQRVSPGAAATAPYAIRGGHAASWGVSNFTNVQSDLTVDAVYSDDSPSYPHYLVYLNEDGSYFSSRFCLNDQIIIDVWKPKLDLPAGYTLTWKIKNEDDSLSDITADMIIEEDMTLQAVYTPVKLFVVIYDYDGRILSTQCVDYGDEYTFTEYGQALTGFNRFNYYRYGIDTEYLPGDTIEVTRNITVTALITSFAGYTVTLKANDTVIDVVYAEADEEFVLPQCSVQVTGKSFTAWSVVGATPAVQYLPGEAVTVDKNYTFEAVYINDYSIFFVEELKVTLPSTNSADVVWSVSWLKSSTHKNEDISKYITIIPNADGLKAIIVCLKPFAGDTIIITVTTKDGKYSAQCFITYAVTGVK